MICQSLCLSRCPVQVSLKKKKQNDRTLKSIRSSRKKDPKLLPNLTALTSMKDNKIKIKHFFTCYIYNRMLTIEAVIDEIALEGHYHLERRVASGSIV